MIDDPCTSEQIGRRKLFWATRQQACGDYVVCGVVCAIPGLEYVDGVAEGERTISTEGWLQGLVLNILNTRARTDMPCPAPQAVFGHWSESYRKDNLYIGSTLWNAAAKPYVRTADVVKAVGAAVKADMAKLVALGIAQSTEVTATYRGQGTVEVVVVVITVTGRSTLNLSGTFVSETWVWQ